MCPRSDKGAARTHMVSGDLVGAEKGSPGSPRGTRRTHHVSSHVPIFMVKSGNPDVVTEVALIDSACAKSVCGRPWAEDAISKCEAAGIRVSLVEEEEPFRFGPGSRIIAHQALLLPVVWGGHTFIVRISVVEKDVPCLLSTGVLRRLGGILDFCRVRPLFGGFRRCSAREHRHRPCGGARTVSGGMSPRGERGRNREGRRRS